MSLRVESIRKKYGDYYAVNELSFAIEKPGVFALLGTNGAGKTTAIRVILGILAKESGSVSWNDRPLDVTDERVGYLAEERGLYPKYNVIEQMYYFARLKGIDRADATQAIDYWFGRLNVDEYRKKRAEQLSKGNQQKIQLAAALICNPDLLILDEPLSGLDPVNTDLFKSIIREQIKRDKYIIMSSHQMPTIEEFCEDIVIMNKGEVVLQGNLNEIKKGYGRINLSVKADENILPLAKECGLEPINHTPNQIDFKVGEERQAEALLKKIVNASITLVKFELREPSLHEIFVEKAGGEANED
ncbi:MAG: ATP-binding cassette domain-containing protein [Oscillospiraceae bacterium]|jgi:ABC-2 type transport system ATP-binding protein|nr:ATP-binding cassette domain-containing protein [Oscillospiraceae bacterium]